MFKNYLKIALRNIKRHKGYSFINITGLAIGMACAITILLWVQDELSHDRFHEKADDIYRVVEELHYTSREIGYNRVTPGPLAPVLKENYPEIINSSRISYWNPILTCEEKNIFCRGGLTDTSFFEMFTFPFVKGDSKTALSNPQSIVITEDLAKRFFENEDPIGKVINDGYDDLKVTGVIKDIPEKSHIRFDFLESFEIAGNSRKSWENNNTYTYVLLHSHSRYKEVSKKIAGVIKEHSPTSSTVLYLQSLDQVHLRALEGGGLITYIYIFLIRILTTYTRPSNLPAQLFNILLSLPYSYPVLAYLGWPLFLLNSAPKKSVSAKCWGLQSPALSVCSQKISPNGC